MTEATNRPTCPHHPNGHPVRARKPTTTQGIWFCFLCNPPRELAPAGYIPPAEVEPMILDSVGKVNPSGELKK